MISSLTKTFGKQKSSGMNLTFPSLHPVVMMTACHTVETEGGMRAGGVLLPLILWKLLMRSQGKLEPL